MTRWKKVPDQLSKYLVVCYLVMITSFALSFRMMLTFRCHTKRKFQTQLAFQWCDNGKFFWIIKIYFIFATRIIFKKKLTVIFLEKWWRWYVRFSLQSILWSDINLRHTWYPHSLKSRNRELSFRAMITRDSKLAEFQPGLVLLLFVWPRTISESTWRVKSGSTA